MKIAKQAKGISVGNNETAGKTFSRAYCHTEGQWIDDWDTHFEIAIMDQKEHQLKTSHAVTVHYK